MGTAAEFELELPMRREGVNSKHSLDDSYR
jgi:hypothetical protein